MTNQKSNHTGECQSTNKNAYSERVAAKKARYIAKAEELNRQSNSLARESSKMSEAIPFGQPILIGHHSETRDRNYRARISKKMDAAVAAQKKS